MQKLRLVPIQSSNRLITLLEAKEDMPGVLKKHKKVNLPYSYSPWSGDLNSISCSDPSSGSWQAVSAQCGKAGQGAGGETGDWNFQEGGLARLKTWREEG